LKILSFEKERDIIIEEGIEYIKKCLEKIRFLKK